MFNAQPTGTVISRRYILQSSLIGERERQTDTQTDTQTDRERERGRVGGGVKGGGGGKELVISV